MRQQQMCYKHKQGNILSIVLTVMGLFLPLQSSAGQMCLDIFRIQTPIESVLFANPQLEETLQNFEGSSKPGSCKVTCDTLVKKVFTNTWLNNLPIRWDVYHVFSLHYHIRSHNGLMIDPTLYQFFNFKKGEQKVFIGNKDALIEELDRLRVSPGFRENFSNFEAMSSQEIYNLLWAPATLYKSGERLKYFEDIGETLYE